MGDIIDSDNMKMGRQMSASDLSVQQKPDDWIDKVLQARQKEAALLGLNAPVGGARQEGSESMAASIVKTAFEVNQKTNEALQQQIRQKEMDVSNALDKTDKAKTELMGIISQQVTSAVDRLEQVKEDIKKGQNVPTKTLVDQVRESIDLLKVLTPQQPAAERQSFSPQDFSSQITMQQMREAHELNMKKFDLEMQKMQSELQLKLAELTDNRKWKELEYQDGKATKQGAMSQIGDIAASIAAGFAGGSAAGAGGGIANQPPAEQYQPPPQQPVYQQPPPAYQPPSPSHQYYEPGEHDFVPGQPPPGYQHTQPKPQGGYQPSDTTAVIHSFPCQKCETEVEVPATGDLAMCQNCGTKYTLNRK
jgi:hypothetical protein